jgi:hypothetical protein
MKSGKLKRLSLSPLGFDEAVTDILKIPPPPKGVIIRKTQKRSAQTKSERADPRFSKPQTSPPSKP